VGLRPVVRSLLVPGAPSASAGRRTLTAKLAAERRQSDVDLAVVRRDVEWIRDQLGGDDGLVNRVGGVVSRVESLEKGQARLQGMVAALTSGIVIVGSLISAAKAIGLV
jgi:archaellum component FlaC